MDLTHGLWLDLIDRGAGDELRHRDVVSVALRRLKRELQTDESDDVLRDVIATVREHGPDKVVVPAKAGREYRRQPPQVNFDSEPRVWKFRAARVNKR